MLGHLVNTCVPRLVKGIGDDLKRCAVGVDSAAERAIMLFRSTISEVSIAMLRLSPVTQIRDSVDEYTKLQGQAASFLDARFKPEFSFRYTNLVAIVERYFADAKHVSSLVSGFYIDLHAGAADKVRNNCQEREHYSLSARGAEVSRTVSRSASASGFIMSFRKAKEIANLFINKCSMVLQAHDKKRTEDLESWSAEMQVRLARPSLDLMRILQHRNTCSPRWCRQ